MNKHLFVKLTLKLFLGFLELNLIETNVFIYLFFRIKMLWCR